jgi:LPXTG-site transpeptidase (sortase) family protein
VAAAAAVLSIGPATGRSATQAGAAGIPGVAASAAPGPSTPASPVGVPPAPAIAQGAPRLLEAPAIGLRAPVTAYTAADVAEHDGAVKPPTLDAVSWWTGGGTPGTDTANTVYLFGHTWKGPAVFNRLTELEVGDDVYVTTANGRLHYVVDGSFTVAKPALGTHPAVTAAQPGRLLLIGCYRETGEEAHTTENVVVSAHLA